MELITMIRGSRIHLKDFLNQMSGQYLNLPITQPDGSVEMGQIQMLIKPYQIVGFAFPKEYRDIMLNTILSPETKGKSQHKKHNKWFNWLRIAMGLKKIPDWTEEKVLIAGKLGKQHLEVIGVGIKEDEDTVKQLPHHEGI